MRLLGDHAAARVHPAHARSQVDGGGGVQRAACSARRASDAALGRRRRARVAPTHAAQTTHTRTFMHGVWRRHATYLRIKPEQDDDMALSRSSVRVRTPATSVRARALQRPRGLARLRVFVAAPRSAAAVVYSAKKARDGGDKQAIAVVRAPCSTGACSLDRGRRRATKAIGRSRRRGRANVGDARAQTSASGTKNSASRPLSAPHK